MTNFVMKHQLFNINLVFLALNWIYCMDQLFVLWLPEFILMILDANVCLWMWNSFQVVCRMRWVTNCEGLVTTIAWPSGFLLVVLDRKDKKRATDESFNSELFIKFWEESIISLRCLPENCWQSFRCETNLVKVKIVIKFFILMFVSFVYYIYF